MYNPGRRIIEIGAIAGKKASGGSKKLQTLCGHLASALRR